MRRKADAMYAPADAGLAAERLKLFDRLKPEVQEEIDRMGKDIVTKLRQRSSKAQFGEHSGREVVMALLQHADDPEIL